MWELHMNKVLLPVALASLLWACSPRESDADGGPRVYVTNEISGDLAVIDPSAREVVARVPLGQRPRGLALSPDGDLLYIALSGSPIAGPGVDESTLPPADKSKDGISVFDVATGRVLRIIRGISDPETVAVSADGRLLYVASEDTGQLVVIDAASGGRRAAVSVGGEPEGVAVSPDGTLVYATSEEDHTAAVVETGGHTLRARIPVGLRPRNAAFTSDGTRAFVPGEDNASITAIDVASDRVLKKAIIPGENVRPMGIVLSPSGDVVYVTTGRGGELLRLDAGTLAVTGRVKVGERPWGVALTGDGKWLVTANGPSNDVAVVDATSMKVVARISTGERPWGALAAPAQ
jgi:YVTN family beta-propeller protein